jgi:RNase H-fold protein (predicted Holliday junction resolvase)
VGEKPSLNRGRVDSVAAAIILQAYFDSNLK